MRSIKMLNWGIMLQGVVLVIGLLIGLIKTIVDKKFYDISQAYEQVALIVLLVWAIYLQKKSANRQIKAFVLALNTLVGFGISIFVLNLEVEFRALNYIGVFLVFLFTTIIGLITLFLDVRLRQKPDRFHQKHD